MTDIKEDKLLDARGLLCPMPIVKAAKEMKGLVPGQILKVLATDRGAIADFPAWADDTGNELSRGTRRVTARSCSSSRNRRTDARESP